MARKRARPTMPSSAGPKMKSANMFIARCQISTWVNAAVTSCHQAPSEKPAWKVAPDASQSRSSMS